MVAAQPQRTTVERKRESKKARERDNGGIETNASDSTA